MKNYYNVLGVNEDADIKDIKKAFRELSLKWHPDRNKEPEAINKIQEINEAYETIGDDEKRRIYDEERRNPRCVQHIHQPFHQPFHQTFHREFRTGFCFSTNNHPFFNPQQQQNYMQQQMHDQLAELLRGLGCQGFTNGTTQFNMNKSGVFVTSFRSYTSK
jgi:DnaJ-class molecular chaperone